MNLYEVIQFKETLPEHDKKRADICINRCINPQHSWKCFGMSCQEGMDELREIFKKHGKDLDK